MSLLAACLIGFSLTASLIFLMIPLARRVGLVDRAGGHKQHAGAVPLVGGLAMYCGFVVALQLTGIRDEAFQALLLGGGLLVIVGVIDDYRHLPAWTRFAAQIGAGLLMTLKGGVVLESLGPLLTPTPLLLGGLAIPFTIFGIIGVINAINMMDGVDGLAGGITVIAATLLLWLGGSAGQTAAVAAAGILLAVVLGFLLFNFPLPGPRRKRVFMGDAGSMLLGYVLAWYLVDLSQQSGGAAFAPVTALWILAFPLFDTVALMVRRISRGCSPFIADREHLHHALLMQGLGTRMVLAVVLLGNFVLALAGIGADRSAVPPWLMFYLLAALFCIYFFLSQHYWTRSR